ncbi:MAG: AbrB/MazE/SpoVT family DNA-binding domain-containing protein, partial [Oscillospiraceae bacterium]|nr:AbrB/MazE/SpoVT family DNA-binding domain-containing protein [Oscillospiraceae bacterium]
MKSIGIVRRVDELGRIVLPIELRRKFDIEEKDSLEIYTEDNCIILKKYEPSCIFCGNAPDIFQFNGKNVCSECAKTLYG